MELTDFGPFTLSAGKHDDPSKGMCVMEMVSFLAGDEWSDMPACACPVIARFCQRVNDRFGQAQRDELQTLVPFLIGTRSERHQFKRAEILAWAAIRKFAPFYLRKAGLVDLPEQLEAFDGSLVDARKLCREGGAAAYAAAYAAADAAAANAAYAAYAAAAAAAAADAAAYAADAAAYAADAAAYAAAADAAYAEIFPLVMDTLREVIAAGPHGEAYTDLHLKRASDLAQVGL